MRTICSGELSGFAAHFCCEPPAPVKKKQVLMNFKIQIEARLEDFIFSLMRMWNLKTNGPIWG